MNETLSKQQIQAIYHRILEAFKTDTPARAAKKIGISRQAVYLWRDGISEPDDEKIEQISKATGVTYLWLKTGQPPKWKSQTTATTKGLTESEFNEIFDLYMQLDDLDREELRSTFDMVRLYLEHRNQLNDQGGIADQPQLAAASSGGSQKLTKREKKDIGKDLKDNIHRITEYEKRERRSKK